MPNVNVTPQVQVNVVRLSVMRPDALMQSQAALAGSQVAPKRKWSLSEQLNYHSIDELRPEPDELRAVGAGPDRRQHHYQTVYQREVRTNGAAGSDALEQQS